MKLSAFIKLLQIPVGRVKSCGQSQVIRPASSVKYNEPCSVGKDIYLGDRIVNTTGADIVIDLGDDNEYKIKGYSAECVAPKYGDPNMPKLLDGLKEITDQTENFTTGVVDDPNDKVIFVVNFLYEKLKEAKGSNLVDGDDLPWYYKKFVRKYANDKKIQKSKLVNTNYAQNLEDDLQNTVFIFEDRDEIITASGDFLDKDSDLSFDSNFTEDRNVSDEVDRIIENQTQAGKKLESLIAQINEDNIHTIECENGDETQTMLEKFDKLEEQCEPLLRAYDIDEPHFEHIDTNEEVLDEEKMIETTLENSMFTPIAQEEVLNEEIVPVEPDLDVLNSIENEESSVSPIEDENLTAESSLEIESGEREGSIAQKDRGFITKIEFIDSNEVAKASADTLKLEADAGSQVMYSVMKDGKIVQGGISLADGRISLTIENLELNIGDKLSLITIDPAKGIPNSEDFEVEKISHNDKTLPTIKITRATLIDESIPADSIPERLDLAFDVSKNNCEVVFRHEGEVLHTMTTDVAGEYHASIKIKNSDNIKPRSNIGVSVVDIAGNTLYDAFEVDAQMDYKDLNFAKILNATAKIVSTDGSLSDIDLFLESSRTGVDLEVYFRGEILKINYVDNPKISMSIQLVGVVEGDTIEFFLKENDVPYARANVKIDTELLRKKIEEKLIYDEIKHQESEALVIENQIKEAKFVVEMNDVEELDRVFEGSILDFTKAVAEQTDELFNAHDTNEPLDREEIVQKQVEQPLEPKQEAILHTDKSISIIEAKLIDNIDTCDTLFIKGESPFPNAAVYVNHDFRTIASGSTDDLGNFLISSPAKYNITTKSVLTIDIEPHGGKAGAKKEVKLAEIAESKFIERLDRKNQISFVRDITKDGVINAAEQTGGVTLARVFLTDNVMVGDVVKISVVIDSILVSCEEFILNQGHLDRYLEVLIPLKEGKTSEVTAQISDRFGNSGIVFGSEIKKITSIPNVSFKSLRLIDEYDGKRLAVFATTDKANCSYTVEHGDGHLLSSGYCDVSGELVAKIRLANVARHDLLILGVADEYHNAGYEEIYVDLDIPVEKERVDGVILETRHRQKMNLPSKEDLAKDFPRK